MIKTVAGFICQVTVFFGVRKILILIYDNDIFNSI